MFKVIALAVACFSVCVGATEVPPAEGLRPLAILSSQFNSELYPRGGNWLHTHQLSRHLAGRTFTDKFCASGDCTLKHVDYQPNCRSRLELAGVLASRGLQRGLPFDVLSGTYKVGDLAVDPIFGPTHAEINAQLWESSGKSLKYELRETEDMVARVVDTLAQPAHLAILADYTRQFVSLKSFEIALKVEHFLGKVYGMAPLIKSLMSESYLLDSRSVRADSVVGITAGKGEVTIRTPRYDVAITFSEDGEALKGIEVSSNGKPVDYTVSYEFTAARLDVALANEARLHQDWVAARETQERLDAELLELAITESDGTYRNVARGDASFRLFTINPDRLTPAGLTYTVADGARPNIIKINGLELVAGYARDGVSLFFRDSVYAHFNASYEKVTRTRESDGAKYTMMVVTIAITPDQIRTLNELLPDKARWDGVRFR